MFDTLLGLFPEDGKRGPEFSELSDMSPDEVRSVLEDSYGIVGDVDTGDGPLDLGSRGDVNAASGRFTRAADVDEALSEISRAFREQYPGERRPADSV